jgi:hypothetical protein
VLVVTAIMYFFLGNILEYIKNAEHKIIIPIIFLFGLMKITVGVYDIFIEHDIDELANDTV